MDKSDRCIYNKSYYVDMAVVCSKTKTWITLCDKKCSGYMNKKMLNQKKIKEVLNGR